MGARSGKGYITALEARVGGADLPIDGGGTGSNRLQFLRKIQKENNPDLM
jgi:hypothetical protein